MQKPAIDFCFNIVKSWDDVSKVWIAYCPTLRLLTQVRDESRVEEAMNTTIESFVFLCWERNLLNSAMRDRGMMKSEKSHDADRLKEKAVASQSEFLMLSGGVRDAWSQVPIELLAGKRTMVGCHR
jgi:hypothetical protein